MNTDGKIKIEQLRRVFLDHKDKGEALQRLAAECGLTSSREIALALSGLMNIPFVDIPEEYHIERSVIRLVPEVIARRYTLIPFEKENEHSLKIIMANPLDLDAVDTVRSQTKLEIHQAVGVEEDIRLLIDRSYQEEAYIEEGLQDIVSLEDIDVEVEIDNQISVELDQLKDRANDVPVIRFVNLLLLEAIRDRASDIHFEPAEKYVAVRFRIDGVLREVTPPPRAIYAAIATRIKILSELDIAEHRLPQDGRFKFRVHDRIIDVRVSVLPVAHGEKIVLRILDRAALLVDMKDVGFDPPMLKEFQRILELPNGIILLTGPTGSGKTTTLYSALSFLKNPEVNIQTVEDPIEYLIDGINQTHIRPKIGLDFASCLRSILRQDPDIIMIGEIRDLETAQIATRSSLTGHLVLSTLHTNDAPSSFSRLKDIGVPAYLIAATVKLVIAQRLVRVICERCKEEYRPPAEDIMLAAALCPGVGEWKFYRGGGCPDCQQTGFRGRTGVFEFMEVTDTLREMTAEHCSDTVLRKAALDGGMESLAHNGMMKVKNGITTLDEVLRVTQF
ncbi:MAG: GspE/PulE family protein [Kiritimatiellales bacterium]|jgi:type IV pilus assembly protein PilB